MSTDNAFNRLASLLLSPKPELDIDDAAPRVILASWGIAFFEHCLQIPANRIGSATFTAFQPKVIQEIISILVFVSFIVFYRHERGFHGTI